MEALKEPEEQGVNCEVVSLGNVEAIPPIKSQQCDSLNRNGERTTIDMLLWMEGKPRTSTLQATTEAKSRRNSHP